MCWFLFRWFNKNVFFLHVNLPTNEKNRSWRKQFSLKFWWKKLNLSVEPKLFQKEPHPSISAEIFSKENPGSFNDRVKNALKSVILTSVFTTAHIQSLWLWKANFFLLYWRLTWRSFYSFLCSTYVMCKQQQLKLRMCVCKILHLPMLHII